MIVSYVQHELAELPFCSLDDDDFHLTLYELANGRMNFAQDRLELLSFNPFALNTRRQLTLNRDIDPDINLFNNLNNMPCDYYLEDQFNTMIKKTCKAKNSFSAFHLNARSINQNFSNFSNLLECLNFHFDVIGISETWLKESDHSVDLVGYNFIHSFRKNRIGGGIGLYLSNDLEFKERSDIHFLDSNTAESLFVEIIKPHGKNIIVGVIYRPPNQNLNSFVNEFSELAEKISRENKILYIMGDFNINLLNVDNHCQTSEFLDGLFSNLLCPMINRPTRITSYTASLIDNIFTNNFDGHMVNGLLFADISDHLPIFSIMMDDEYYTQNRITQTYRDKSIKNVEKFKDKLANCDWFNTIGQNNPTNAYSTFIDKFTSIYNECFPIKRSSKKRRIRKPWISKGLLKSIKTKNKLYKQLIRKPNPNSERVYKDYKNKLNHSIRMAKRLYYDEKLTENKANIKQTWNLLNSIMNKNKQRSSPNIVFRHDDKEISDPTEIANHFCNFFSNIGPNLARNIPNTNVSPKSFLPGEFLSSIFIETVSEAEVITIAKNFQSGKATGYDNIPISTIKSTIDIIAKPLTHIINMSFKYGIFPDQLKISRVVPLFKSGDKSTISNYRPVSVLPAFSKIFEKAFYNRLVKYLNRHDILCKNQYGFRKAHSTAFALIDLYEKISKSIDNKEVAIGIFMDLSKAFDAISHEILFQKLEHYGIRGIALDWVKSYFCNRRQFVSYKNASSHLKYISCGVPQGSILGPLLFLIYINDICYVSNFAKLILFADDTNLFFTDKDPVYLNHVVNRELESFSVWLATNKLSLNLKKTKFIDFKSKQKRTSAECRVLINNQEIEQVKENVFLGIILDENLTWKSHISQVSSKVSKSIGIIRKSSYYLLKSSLRTLYFAMLYPYLQYCNIVWASTYESNLRRLVILQKRAIRIINKSEVDAHTTPIFRNMKLLKFCDINKLQVGQFMFKYKNNLLPQSFKGIFTTNSEVHRYHTRSLHSFHIPSKRTKLAQFSISYQGPHFFNSLDKKIVNCNTYSSFTNTLKDYLLSFYIQ